MGIFQTLDRLEEAVDALLNTESAASSSTLQQIVTAKNTKKSINCSLCSKSFATLGHLKYHMRVHTVDIRHKTDIRYLFPVKISDTSIVDKNVLRS